MNSRLSDPNNHVPEVRPEDSWGDGDVHASHETALALLPKRKISKTVEGISSPTEEELEETGLRIDVSLVRPILKDPTTRLEIVEMGMGVIRLDQEDAQSSRPPRQIVFKERQSALEAEAMHKGLDHEWGDAKNHPIRWMLWMGGSTMALIVLGIFLLPLVNRPNAPEEKWLAAEPEPVVNDNLKNIKGFSRIMESRSAACQMFATFLRAKSMGEIVSLLRNGPEIVGDHQADWRAHEVAADWDPSAGTQWVVFETAGHVFGILLGDLPDFSPFRAYFVATPAGMLLDWKATTGYGTASFDDLAKGLGDPSEIRGELELSDFYGAATPEEDYQCYRFVSPDSEGKVWCYAPKGAKSEIMITSRVSGGAISKENVGPQRLTLRLEKGPEGFAPNQWLATELLHTEWVSP